jgi:DNA-binding MarR family transcriptional regulator
MGTKSITELALEFGRGMTELKNYMRQFIQAKIKESGINITFEMLEIMACLWTNDGINQQEIADITIKDKSSMTYLVDNLVKRNMVMRMPDENDRRNNLIFLTKEGKQLHKKIYPWLLEMYEKATIEVSTSDIESSLSLVKRMIENMKG